MKKTIRVLLAAFSLIMIEAEKITELKTLIQPTGLHYDEGFLYVTGQEAIHLYELDPVRLIKSFGTKGEGPGEFNSPPLLTVYSDQLLINCMGKLLIYSKTGDFKNQVKLPLHYFYFYFPMLKVGDFYAGMLLERDEERKTFVYSGKIFNSGFQVQKTIHRGGSPQLLPPGPPGSKISKVDFEIIPDCLEVGLCGENFIIGDSSKGFYFRIFNQTGTLIKKIDLPYTRIKVPARFKRETMQRLKESPEWENLKARFNYIIKDEYPAFFSVKVYRDKIHVSTYAEKNGSYEMVVLDPEGTVLHRAFSFPLGPDDRILSGFTSFSQEYAVSDERIFWLRLNEETMIYELHSRPLINSP